MGLQLEFNWYLVLKESAEKIEEGYYSDTGYAEEDFIATGSYYRTHKSGARVYPIGGVVPVVQEDQAIGLAHIREVSHRLGIKGEIMTVIDFDQVLTFNEGDSVANHYTDMYKAYKDQQESANNGGRVKVEDFVNALNRRNFERALKETGYDA